MSTPVIDLLKSKNVHTNAEGKEIPIEQMSDEQARRLKIKDTAVPTFLSVKKVVTTVENYRIKKCCMQQSTLEDGLLNGNLNMVQMTAVEDLMWVVNTDGRRVAILEKDSGEGPDEICTVRTEVY